jgi:uncharacterized protein (DUF4415 family)
MKKSRIPAKSQTDWARVDAQTDAEIDLSETPEITPEMFAKAAVRFGLKPVPLKAQITLRVDSDVLDWFKTQGRGYQTRINALLRAYMNASGRRPPEDTTRERRTRSVRHAAK